MGVVPVPDPRFDALVQQYTPKKVVPATVEFVDIAGLVKGASKGEGKGNAFLSHIRDVDAIAHVVRCFEDDNIVHVDGRVDPAADIETIETELILKDLETVQKRLDRARRAAKGQDPLEKKAVVVCEALEKILDGGELARHLRAERRGRGEHRPRHVPADAQADLLRGERLRGGRRVTRRQRAREGGPGDRRTARCAGGHHLRRDRSGDHAARAGGARRLPRVGGARASPG